MAETRQIAYETDGPLTVCPCCGGRTTGEVYVCDACLRRQEAIDIVCWAQTVPDGRSAIYDLGVRLRAEGKMPPLKAKEQKWGVWVVDEKYKDGTWCMRPPNWDTHFVGARASAEDYAARRAAEFRDARYEVRPYPDGQYEEVVTPTPPPKRLLSQMVSAHTDKACACRTDGYKCPAHAPQFRTFTASVGGGTAHFVPPFTDEMLARAIFVTDPRVKEFIRRRGDNITATMMFNCNEGGWRTEAEARAKAVSESLEYYADVAQKTRVGR